MNNPNQIANSMLNPRYLVTPQADSRVQLTLFNTEASLGKAVHSAICTHNDPGSTGPVYVVDLETGVIEATTRSSRDFD